MTKPMQMLTEGRHLFQRAWVKGPASSVDPRKPMR